MSFTAVFEVSCITMGIIFLWAACAKLIDFRLFAGGLVDLRVVPERAANATSCLVIAAEFVVGTLHFTLNASAGSMIITIALLAIFFAVVLRALLMKLDVPCYCFGRSGHSRISHETAWGIVAMILCELLLLLYRATTSLPEASSASHFVCAVAGAVALSTIISWLGRAGELAAIARNHQ